MSSTSTSVNEGFTARMICIAILVTTVCLVSGCVGQMRKGSNPAANSNVRFSYIDRGAKSVCVAGDFNGWSEGSHCMKREGEAWSIELTLAPGRYQYLFVVDHKVWRLDPGAFLTQANDFGGENCVLIVDR